MSTESMTWAGPLPRADAGGDVVETVTFAGPLAVIASEPQSVSADGPMMWAGPLPAWAERSPAKARFVASCSAEA